MNPTAHTSLFNDLELAITNKIAFYTEEISKLQACRSSYTTHPYRVRVTLELQNPPSDKSELFPLWCALYESVESLCASHDSLPFVIHDSGPVAQILFADTYASREDALKAHENTLSTLERSLWHYSNYRIYGIYTAGEEETAAEECKDGKSWFKGSLEVILTPPCEPLHRQSLTSGEIHESLQDVVTPVSTKN